LAALDMSEPLAGAPMQATLETFLRALRANDVQISPAEAIDAHRAAREIGFADRTLLRDALCVTLAKSAAEVDRFEACFDLFFARAPTSETAPRPQAQEDAGAPPETRAPEAFDLETALTSGDAAGLAAAMEASAARVGAAEIRLVSQRSLMTRRLLDDMGLRGLEARIQAGRAADDADARALAERLAEGRAALFEQAGAFVDRQAQLFAGQSGRRMRDQILARQKLTAVEPEDIRAMEALVKRMARRLAAKYSRKRHRSRKGRLDVRRTLRKSLGYGGVPFEIVWKTKTVEKPKITVLCDVSRSVASAAQFLLLFLYSLNEVVERLDAYAFSDHAVCVNDLLNDETVDDAITLILDRVGFRSTDYGRALQDVLEMQGGQIDRRTTVIVLGDGRSNYAEPRLDLMRAISERARSVIWLNPEPDTYWGQGDSKMDAYARFCTVAKPCNTLDELERIIEDVLRKYLPK
jgi:uncharacterized protein with von Willebrand factor type A (vWA) domain